MDSSPLQRCSITSLSVKTRKNGARSCPDRVNTYRILSSVTIRFVILVAATPIASLFAPSSLYRPKRVAGKLINSFGSSFSSSLMYSRVNAAHLTTQSGQCSSAHSRIPLSCSILRSTFVNADVLALKSMALRCKNACFLFTTAVNAPEPEYVRNEPRHVGDEHRQNPVRYSSALSVMQL